MSDSSGIENDRLKLRFLRPKGEISRRELLKLVVPRYQVVPFVEPSLCPGAQQCGLCRDSCLPEAIKTRDDGVNIDTQMCNGCGACVGSCPYRAISYPSYSPEQLDEKIASALSGSVNGPGIITLACNNCSLSSDEDTAVQMTPAGISVVEIPCLAMVSLWLLLRAFERGARGLALIKSHDECAAGVDSGSWQENIRFVQGLLEGWGIETERIRSFTASGDTAGITWELEQFISETVALGDTPLQASALTSLPGEGLILQVLIKEMNSRLGSPPGITVTAGKVSFGRLELDGSRCSGCGLCVIECPTEALTLSSGDESSRILFRHDLCVACGRCADICPEKCLKVERVLEVDKLQNSAVVLFEGNLARCRCCGNIIGSQAMVRQLRLKLTNGEGSLASQLELCPECKVGQLILGSDIPEPVTGVKQ
ncbi:MAG: 4Fe-4S binding protein [Dehalococcoidales bacterium]|nr:MAG: 4Fe-4S binding protein [Dehalococcoidales bacterium]